MSKVQTDTDRQTDRQRNARPKPRTIKLVVWRIDTQTPVHTLHLCTLHLHFHFDLTAPEKLSHVESYRHNGEARLGGRVGNPRGGDS